MALVSLARRQAAAIIAKHANSIADQWREAVRADQQMGGDERLPDLLLVNQVPALLADIAAALADPDEATSDASIARRRRGLRFGKLRGLAHYDAADLYLEFKHLRSALWRALRRELEWQRGDAFEVMLVVDQYLDEVIGASLRGFFEASVRVSEAPRFSGERRASGGAPGVTAPPTGTED
jgi:hypothetical protein